MMRRGGFTLVEFLAAAVISGALLLSLVSFGTLLARHFRRVSLNQRLSAEARMATDVLTRRLRQGAAGSLVRCSCEVPAALCLSAACAAPAAPSAGTPFTHLEVSTGGSTAYSFYLSDHHTLQMDVYRSEPAATLERQTLASDVANVTFGGDLQDPAVVEISLDFIAPYDGSGLPDHVERMLISNRRVHLAEPS